MEVRDAARRILWHYKLLILFVALGGLAPLLLVAGSPPTYVSATRLVVSTDTETPAPADTVAAIATSDTQVRLVLSRSDIDREAGSVASHVSARAIGTSGVVELTVADQDPLTAVLLAKGLATQVTDVMKTSGLTSPPLPYVVETASLSTTREVAAGRVQDVALGAIAGLVLGILFVALLETLSPTVVGEDAIAAELDAPVLAVLPGRRRIDERLLKWATWQVTASAKRVDVQTVEVTTVDPSIDVLPLSEVLSPVSPESRDRTAVNGIRVRAFELDGHPPFSASGSVGLAIASPTVVKRANLEPVRDLIRITGWPVVGVIAFEPSGIVGWMRGPSPNGHGAPHDGSPPGRTVSVRAGKTS